MMMDGQKRVIYCRLSSGEQETDQRISVNIQLEFWLEATALWHELKEKPDLRRKSRLAITVFAAGASLSNLLGQNVPPETDRRGEEYTLPPQQALRKILFDNEQEHSVGPKEPTCLERRQLLEDFTKFLEFYDAVRHFGPAKHDIVNSLDFAKVTEFMRLAQDVWLTVIHIAFEGNPSSEQLEHFGDEFAA